MNAVTPHSVLLLKSSMLTSARLMVLHASRTYLFIMVRCFPKVRRSGFRLSDCSMYPQFSFSTLYRRVTFTAWQMCTATKRVHFFGLYSDSFCCYAFFWRNAP